MPAAANKPRQYEVVKPVHVPLGGAQKGVRRAEPGEVIEAKRSDDKYGLDAEQVARLIRLACIKPA